MSQQQTRASLPREITEFLENQNLAVTLQQTNFGPYFGIQVSGDSNGVTVNLVPTFFPLGGDTTGNLVPSIPQVLLKANIVGIPLLCTFTADFTEGEISAEITTSVSGPQSYSGPIGIIPTPS